MDIPCFCGEIRKILCGYSLLSAAMYFYLFSSRLKALLHKVEVDFEETCYLTEGVDQCQPTYNNIPWVDVMAICIDYKLATFDVMDPNVNTQVWTRLHVLGFHDEL